MRTDEKLKEICDNLRNSYGDFPTSCRQAGCSTDFVSRWMKDDSTAAAEIEEAQRLGYLSLESAAIQRGVHGIKKGIYYKGEKVDEEVVYSDGLLTKLMEARLPAYNKKEGSGNTFNGPTQINIMPRAENFEQWLEMKKTTLEQREQAKLPPPNSVPEILQGEYVDVSDAAKAAYELMKPVDVERPLKHLAGLL